MTLESERQDIAEKLRQNLEEERRTNMANKMIDQMRDGNRDTILSCLSHTGAIYRMNAISYASLSELKDDEVIGRIKELKRNNVKLDGYSVGDFASAALDILNIERYTGDSVAVRELIKSKFDFMIQ